VIMKYQWANPEKIGVIRMDGERVVYIDAGPEYDEAIAGGPAEYKPPTPVPDPKPAETIAAWRAGAVASQAQIRLTLHQLGLLDQVQALVDADPEAAIVWEYADSIRRASPFIDALKGEKFTDAQIDDIFRYAMDLKI
jgi:hypothetical protein